jgi:hypothetical protein
MNKLAEKYRDKRVGSIFLYTNEAHPGENYPHHTTFDQIIGYAKDLRDILGVSRPILVDAQSGDCHWAYGSMPNMTWIFNRAGTTVYKSDWADVTSVDRAIEYYLSVNQRRRNKELLAPFKVERLDYRVRDMDGFYQGLERSGPKVVDEFRNAF